MNDELQVRELLAVAAELPDEVSSRRWRGLIQRGQRQPGPARRARRRDGRRRGHGGRRHPSRRSCAHLRSPRPTRLPGCSAPGRRGPDRPGRGPSWPGSAGLRLPPSLGHRDYPVVAWTGRELIELGGLPGAGPRTLESRRRTFRSATGRWRTCRHRLPQHPGSARCFVDQQPALFVSVARPRRAQRSPHRPPASRRPGSTTRSPTGGRRPGCPPRWTDFSRCRLDRPRRHPGRGRGRPQLGPPGRRRLQPGHRPPGG